MTNPRSFVTAIVLCFFALSICGQTSSLLPSVFMECKMNCHTRYVKENITFVNYVRDQQVADIFILATSQRAAAGTREVQLIFQGSNRYEGMADTIVFYLQANVSDAVDRELLVYNLKKGLLPFLLESNLVDDIDYNVVIDEEELVRTEVPDPWNFWSFNVGADGGIDGEERQSEIDLSSRFSASQITEKSKFTLFTRYSYSLEKFKLTDGEEVESKITRFFIFTEYVKSISNHWSIGFRANAGSSSFGNTDVEGYFSPAIEYNIYPYSSAQTRRFSFLYSVGPKFNDYTSTTIFDKDQETLIRQELRMDFDQTQKWGEMSISGRFRQFLHDLNLFSAQINPNIELNIVKGLRLDFGGYIEYVGDRINIAKSDISDQDILLQIKQLDTSYSFFTYIGFNYRFGSQQNNIVNPRF